MVPFLFTDVEGSTQLLHELGPEGYAAALAEHRRVSRDAFARHGGVEVDTQGDAFFVAFSTAEGAIEAAMDAQAQLTIAVRMGIHTGTPYLAEEGYVGADVHRAARIAAAGHGGQVLVSASTAALIGSEGVVELGEHRLKDFDEPVPLYQLGDESFPPLKTISNTNLPRPASSFVGREREVEEVASLLKDGTRLLTLTGPGGSGKTRLALEAAAELVPALKAGVFWVGLAPLRNAALVTETIAQTLGAKDGLAEHIGEREMLLLLDNLEQVVEAAPELAVLVETCPNLRLLVTSRELLRVRGEVEYPVPPLAEPEAVELFCTRARTEPEDAVHAGLPRARQPPARHRARRREGARALAEADRGAAFAAARPAQGRARCRSAPADAARDDRVVVRPARAGREAAIRAARRLPRRLHARCRRGGRRGGPRHAPVARRQEPASPHRRALLDAGDDPRVRRRAVGGVGPR
jgi:hypothetical protein